MHAAIFVAPLAVPSLYGPMNGAVLHDVLIYFDDASRTARGMMPYRDFPVEYPPLSLVLMLAPRVLAPQFAGYVVSFAAEMLLFDLLALYAVARWVAMHAGRSQVPIRLGWYTLFVASLYTLMAARYDVAVSAVAFLAATWWFCDRWVRGGATAAAGTLLKVYPIFIAGPAFVYEIMRIRASRLRGSLTFAAILAGTAAAASSLGGAAFLRYHLERGLQVETLWAGILMATAMITRTHLRWEYNHGAAELIAPASGVLAALSLPIQFAALILTVWRFCRSGCRDPVRYAGAGVLAFILPGKVLSPQYLIWLIPFVTVLRGRLGAAARIVFLLGCMSTTLLFPWTYLKLVAFDPWAISLLNIRNAMLLALFAMMLWGPETGYAEPSRTA